MNMMYSLGDDPFEKTRPIDRASFKTPEYRAPTEIKESSPEGIAILRQADMDLLTANIGFPPEIDGRKMSYLKIQNEINNAIKRMILKKEDAQSILDGIDVSLIDLEKERKEAKSKK